MRTISKLLLALAVAMAFSLAQPVEAAPTAGGLTIRESVPVPDGGSTVSLLGCALLGLAALRRKLGC
jgi:protein with PEP-CTERM/exosortase system signal